MSAGKQSVQTWNSVTCPAGVMRPTFFPGAFGLLMNDSVNQKLPSLARTMCSGLLPVVGTLNCFRWSGGAADAELASVVVTTTATTIDRRLRVRRVMIHSRVESPASRGMTGRGSTRLATLPALRLAFGARAASAVDDNAGMFVRVWEVRSGATMPPTTS